MTFSFNSLGANRWKKRLEPRKPGYPGWENNMADQGNSKGVYHFSGEFLQECHISSTRNHKNNRETTPKNAMNTKS